MQEERNKYKACNCGGSFYGYHHIFVDISSGNIREVEGTTGPYEEVKRTVPVEQLNSYLSLLEQCFCPEFRDAWQKSTVEGETFDCGKMWNVGVRVHPGAYLHTEPMSRDPRLIFNWKGVDQFVTSQEARTLIRSLFSSRVSEFVALLRKHRLMAESAQFEMPADAQDELTFPEFYDRYLNKEKKNQKPDRKRKAPKRWGFDEQ